MSPAWRPSGNPAGAFDLPAWRLPVRRMACGHFILNRRIETGERAVLFRREVRPVVKQTKHFSCGITYGSHRPVLGSCPLPAGNLSAPNGSPPGFVPELRQGTSPPQDGFGRSLGWLRVSPPAPRHSAGISAVPAGRALCRESAATGSQQEPRSGHWVTGPPSVSVDTSRSFWMQTD